MALQKQVDIYSVDTGDFFTSSERRLNNKIIKIRREASVLKAEQKAFKSRLRNKGLTEGEINEIEKPFFDVSNLTEGLPAYEDILEYADRQKLIRYKKRKAKETKEKLSTLLLNKTEHNVKTNGTDHIRKLNSSCLNEKNIISVFDSSVSRTLGIEKDEFSEALIVLQIYYFEVFRDMEYFGFEFNGKKYVYYTSSAGQIRKKKAVFISEDEWQKHEKTLMCGLTVEKINEMGGNNVNKHLAYMALSNSATDLWEDFDIDKSIVIDDFETEVFGTYDFIDDSDYSITRKSGNVPVPHTDGAGMILSGNNKMCRLPWIKGLLGVYDYVGHIKEHGYSPVIKDIYGEEHDVIKEDIRVIFTKSQFKGWKFYKNWDEYKTCFKKYSCTAGVCNEEEERIKNAHLNYQMLQTLTDMTDEELLKLTQRSSDKLRNICASTENLLDIFGVNPYNYRMTPLQQSLKLYPNLLNDPYLKATIRDIKDRLVKRYKAGHLEVKGKYTFILPDFYAACDYWFGGNDNPDGLLSDEEVFCDLFPGAKKLDCLRSPHLYKEHAIRTNTAFNENEKKDEIKRWFTTNAIYTSCHDLISKILQFDVDGDKSLVVADETLIAVAERNMRDIVPLYYNMRKAPPSLLTPENMYEGLHAAFVGGNIGIYSNNISKIWNSTAFQSGDTEKEEEALKIIKLLCMENNFVIDYAKTLYKPERPSEIHKIISSFTREKLPNFFIYAKDKKCEQVRGKSESIVDKIEPLIKNPRLSFKNLKLDKINISSLMENPSLKIDKDVIDEYTRLNRRYHFKIGKLEDGFGNISHLAREIKHQLSVFGYKECEICDMLVKYLYGEQKKSKEILWLCYGNYIASNLRVNLGVIKTKFVQCHECGEWIEVPVKNNRSFRCKECQKVFSKRLRRKRYSKTH